MDLLNYVTSALSKVVPSGKVINENIENAENSLWNLGGTLLNKAGAHTVDALWNIGGVVKNTLLGLANELASNVDENLSNLHHQKANEYFGQAGKDILKAAGNTVTAVAEATGAAAAGIAYVGLEATKQGINAIAPQKTYEQKIAEHLSKAYFDDSFLQREKDLITTLEASKDIPMFLQDVVKFSDLSIDLSIDKIVEEFTLIGDVDSAAAA